MERRPYYRVERDGTIVDRLLTGDDSVAEREHARELAVKVARQAARRGGHVVVVFELPYDDGVQETWLSCSVWDSVKAGETARACPYRRPRLSPLACRTAPPLEGLTARAC